MKELLKQYASYNFWANQRLMDLILPLPEEKQHQTIISSFDSVHKTVLHMWDAEAIWWQRLKLQERVILPSENAGAVTQDVVQGLLQQSKLWDEWVSNATPLSIEHVFQYYNTKREHFKTPVYQVLQHMFNHSTYHRGQLVTMLRQLGTEKIPSTDFIIWTRKK